MKIRSINSKRNPIKFDALELLSYMTTEQKLVIDNKDDIRKFAQELEKSLSNDISPTLLYGKRVEKMFAYIAAALGKCKMVKGEDCGEFFSGEDVKIPDYRLILDDGRQFLVEVKNICQKKIKDEFKISCKNFNEYIAYSKLVNVPLYFAIYWTKMNLWTLVDINTFKPVNKGMSISLTEAAVNNQMIILGDCMLATKPPLKVRIYTNKLKKRNINTDNTAEIFIDDVEFYCNDVMINDVDEKNIIYNFVSFGLWNEENEIVLEENSNNIDYIDFYYNPDQYDEKQGFAVIGNLSTIIARQYLLSTSSKDGKIKNIVPMDLSSKFGIALNKPYVKKDLPLWIFYLKPSNNANAK